MCCSSTASQPYLSGGAKWKNIPNFAFSSRFFPLFPDFPLFFLISPPLFGIFFAVKGTLSPFFVLATPLLCCPQVKNKNKNKKKKKTIWIFGVVGRNYFVHYSPKRTKFGCIFYLFSPTNKTKQNNLTNNFLRVLSFAVYYIRK